jgi:hypothetical protein
MPLSRPFWIIASQRVCQVFLAVLQESVDTMPTNNLVGHMLSGFGILSASSGRLE